MHLRESLAVLLALNLVFALNPAAAQTPAQNPAAPPVQDPAQAPPAQQTPAAPTGAPGLAQSPAASVPVIQPATPLAQIAGPMVESLKVLILQGDRAVNDTSTHIGVQPVIEVRDDNDRPVEGANVVFRLPPDGPGGTFDGKSLSKSARTNAEGQAGVTGFVPNSDIGRFDVHVTALLGSRMGQAVIRETNSESRLVIAAAPEKKRPLWLNKYILIGAGLAVAAGIAVAVSRSSTKSVTITPGTVAINQ